MAEFSQKLAQLKGQGRHRSLVPSRGVDFTSNDYLGFNNHPKLRRAALDALESGLEIGAGGSRLLRGHTESHAALEDFAAGFFFCEKTLYFSTGFQANMALFTALPTRRDTVIFDSLIHASARDGIQASKASHIRAAHNDLMAYEAALERARQQGGQIFVAVESLYSMDGDFAPLAEIYALAKAYGAFLIVDEAHATGVWGPGGRGLAAALFDSVKEKQPADLITLHTCGKALGVAGGMVCASAEIVDYLVNTARPFIYSTAPLPLQAVLVQTALALAGSGEGESRRAKLSDNCAALKRILAGSGLDLGGWDSDSQPSQIVPVIVGEDARAVDLASHLQEAGYDVRAIRPPTVPEGTARLRLSLSAEMDMKILKSFAESLMAAAGGKRAGDEFYSQ